MERNDLQKKPLMWPWIVGTILAFLIVVIFTRTFHFGERRTPLVPVNASLIAIPDEIYNYMEFADYIQVQPGPISADTLKTGFLSASDIFYSMQRVHFPELQAQVLNVRNAAGSIRMEKPLMEQQENVLRFFKEADETIKAMVKVLNEGYNHQ